MRKLLLAVLLLLLLTGVVWAEDTAVSSMDTVCTVAEDGSCVVALQFQVEFAAGTDHFAIPVAAEATNITVSGASYTISRSGKYTMIELQPPLTGSRQITVAYHLAETVTATDAGQRFRVTLLYPEWSCGVSNYTATIHMPKAFDGMPVILSGYFQDLIDNYMDIRIEDGTIHADLMPSQSLLDHETISLSLDLPGGYFDLRFLAGKTAATDRLLFFGFVILSLGYWLVFLRGRPILAKRQAMAPVGGNAGEVPYVLTGSRPDLALMVVQWATLGYLTIHRSRRGRIWLTRQIDMGNERKPYEVTVFRGLFARSDRCDVRSESYLRARNVAAERAKTYWRDRAFRPPGSPMILRLLALAAGLALCLACFDITVASRSWRWFLIVPLTLLGGAACWMLQWVGGCLLRRHPIRTAALAFAAGIFLLIIGRRSGQTMLMLLCMAFQLLTGFALRCGGRRTKEGKALASELLGYRRYLLITPSAALRNNLEADPQFFYRSLPYADALGVGKLFSGSFDRTRLEDCDWLDWEGKPAKIAPLFYSRYVRLMAGLRGEREPLLYRPRRRRR